MGGTGTSSSQMKMEVEVVIPKILRWRQRVISKSENGGTGSNSQQVTEAQAVISKSMEIDSKNEKLRPR